MWNRVTVFSLFSGALLVTIGALLAQANLSNWSLSAVGGLLISIALLPALTTLWESAPTFSPTPDSPMDH